MKYKLNIIAGCLLGILIYSCGQQTSYRPDLIGSEMPVFDILLTDSASKFNTKQIPNGVPIILMYFEPTCPYCKVQTKEIVAAISEFRNVKFYILANSPAPQLKKYIEEFNLSKYSNITVAEDYSAQFIKYYNPTKIPCTVVYNSNKRLQYIFNGRTGIASIRNLVHTNYKNI